MDNMEKYYDQMDDYLKGNLSGQALELFEYHLQNNPKFAEDLIIHKNILRGIANQAELDFKKDLDLIHNEVIQPKGKNRKLWPAIAIAASFALLIGFGMWYLSDRPDAPKQLFVEFYQPANISLITRNGTVDAQLAKAEKFYKEGDYAAALPAFLQKTEKDTNDVRLLMAVGICYLELGEHEKGVGQFAQIFNSKDPFFSDLAKWYTAMAYLKKGEPEKAKGLLQTFANNPGADKNKEASEILKRLKTD